MASVLADSLGEASALVMDSAIPDKSKMAENDNNGVMAARPSLDDGMQCDNDGPRSGPSQPAMDEAADNATNPPDAEDNAEAAEATNGASSLPNATSQQPPESNDISRQPTGEKSPRKEHDHLRSAERLVTAPIPEGDKGDARSPKVKSATARANNNGGQDKVDKVEEILKEMEEAMKPRGKKGGKTLAMARQNYERAVQAEGGAASAAAGAPPPPLEGEHKIQFLAAQPGSPRKDYRHSVTYPGTIFERVAAVPKGDARGLEATILGMKAAAAPTHNGGTGGGERTAASAAAGPPSGDGWIPVGPTRGAMHGTFPSMAPPMFPDRPRWPPPEEEKARKKKGKKKRGRESTGSDAGGRPKKSKKGKKTEATSPAGTKPPPPPLPSPLRIAAPRGPGVVTLPDPTPRVQTHEIVTDERPRRMCHPLLRMPQLPLPPGTPGSTRPDPLEVPQGAELWHLADIHYALPDTYPVGYLARVLGFDVPEEGVGREFGAKFDPGAVGKMKFGSEESGVEEAGTFATQCYRPANPRTASGVDDDRHLSYCDPQWAHILSSYQGFNDEEFKDAGKGYDDELNPNDQCLGFARERGVLPKEGGLSFRFGGEEDEAMLKSLMEQCPWKCNPKSDLGSCLRGPGHYCIVAELPPPPTEDDGKKSGSRGPAVAFVQYRFCWYKVEEKKKAGNVSTDRVSELILFIDNLICAKDACDDNEMETAKVLLTSLALVHGARVDTWYGTMDAPPEIAPLMTRFFRMSDVSRGASTSSSTIPLVVDIKKCHYRYSILLLEESLRSSRGKQSGGSGSERMLVSLKNEPTSSLAHLDAATRTQPGHVGVYSNSSNKAAQSKQAHVRLNANAELFSVSTSIGEEGGEAKEVVNPIDPSSIDTTASWSVMRSFSCSEVEAQEDGASTVGDDDDIFVAELKKKQAKLQALESSIEGTSRAILSKAYDEQTAFVTGSHRADLEADNKKLAEYKAVITRLHEAELAWQAQLDQDMDAECDVCFDGEVTPDNQIIFCDACNVAIHQRCYGIDKIPSGNFFCHTCKHFEMDKEYLANRRREGPPTKITRHPIVCELCPRRQGAFVQVQTLVPTKKAKWVHVGCAKWQGMNYVDIVAKDKIEDLTQLKEYFKVQRLSCMLCKSGIGALHQCREKGCDKWFHLTCARSFGKCSVQHGENCEGFYNPEDLDNPPWTLACPKHSEVDPESIKEASLSTEQLIALAATYPPEPVPPKPFNRMNATERKEYWADKDNLEEFFNKVMPSLDGDKCAMCEGPADPTIDKRCDKCGVFSHADCSDPTRGSGATCIFCRFKEEFSDTKNYEEPRCHMCNHPNESVGPLVRSFAKPVTMRKWKLNMSAFRRSTFGHNKFVHGLCGMWNTVCNTQSNEYGDIVINCSNSTMANGKDHVSHQFRCTLCGLYSGAKVDCCAKKCVAPGGTRTKPKFHVTCARQAGLEASSGDDFAVKCWNDVDCTYVFRARLEDMRELELQRNTSKTFKASIPITWTHASSLFHSAVNILKTLGWAWRWADWWVENGDNWEPLLEPGQREEDMTEAELKIVRSTPESRCKDARRCRLAAFGAALRNRDYDKNDGDDQEPLERALTAILSTQSLVGPLKKKEIEFFATWLALAYRSKSPVLGFGDDKAPVATDCFCVHQDGGSPKYELGSRPLPGKTAPEKGVFEPPVEEVDDFLKAPVSGSPERKSKKRKKKNDDEEPPLERAAIRKILDPDA